MGRIEDANFHHMILDALKHEVIHVQPAALLLQRGQGARIRGCARTD